MGCVTVHFTCLARAFSLWYFGGIRRLPPEVKIYATSIAEETDASRMTLPARILRIIAVANIILVVIVIVMIIMIIVIRGFQGLGIRGV